jgi:hypothetical protein
LGARGGLGTKAKPSVTHAGGFAVFEKGYGRFSRSGGKELRQLGDIGRDAPRLVFGGQPGG